MGSKSKRETCKLARAENVCQPKGGDVADLKMTTARELLRLFFVRGIEN